MFPDTDPLYTSGSTVCLPGSFTALNWVKCFLWFHSDCLRHLLHNCPVFVPAACISMCSVSCQTSLSSENHSFISTDTASPFFPHSSATMATPYDRQTTRAGGSLSCSQPGGKHMIIMSVWGVGTWTGSHWGEWEREKGSLMAGSDGTIWAISHFFWYTGLMLHLKKKVCISTVVDVEGGDFVSTEPWVIWPVDPCFPPEINTSSRNGTRQRMSYTEQR